MAQQGKKKSTRKQAPRYSSNMVALRYVSGLLLTALGVLMFMAVAMNTDGSIFDAMRGFTYGMGGVLAIVLPVLPVWGGVLLILSAQRKAPVRAFVMVSALYLLVLTAATLMTQTLGSTGTMSLMDFLLERNGLRYTNPGDYDVFLARGFEMGRDYHNGGGLLGMLLSWPLWKLIGAMPGFVVAAVLALGNVLLLFRKEIARLIAWAKQRGEERRQQSEQEQAELRMREMQWRAQQPAPIPHQPQPADSRYHQQPAPASYDPQRGAPVYHQQPAQKVYRPQPDGNVSMGFGQNDNTHYTQMTADMLRGQQASYTAELTAEKKKREKKTRRPQMFPAKQPMESDKLPQEHAQNAPVGADDAYDYQQPAPEAEAREATRPSANRKTKESLSEQPQKVHGGQPMQSPWQQEVEKKQAEIAAAAQLEEETQGQTDNTPPWENPAPRASSSAGVRVKAPKLQQEPPAAVWQPELNLPPRKEVDTPEEEDTPVKKKFIKPPISELLNEPIPFYNAQDSAEDEERIRILEATVESFKMPATVEQVTHGPRISRFELRPDPGILVKRYQMLAGNIAMNMSAESVRIETPIPGTEYVGVEIPNKTAKLVTLREVLESPEMKAHPSPLAVALGCDVAGRPRVCNIIDMPHLLIGGATKMGKSVCINSLINSILYRATPAEVRMILIDPKVVELQCYNGLPHLLLPVVNDPKKAAAALNWAVAEMMERFNTLFGHGVRKIEEYNNNLPEGKEKMPYILIVIDEMADLMMTCGKDVEASIQRLSQLARAAGIHLVLATQRPTVKVITGNIKANIMGRIAFKTSSTIDSQTILDGKGAEGLLGNGDMIYKGEKDEIRIQGCFISTEEIEKTVKYICDNNTTEYDPDIVEQVENTGEDAVSGMPGGDDTKSSRVDPLLLQAIEWTVQERQISVSNLQRKLSLGYARAARLVDMMEERGIVSPKDGIKPRSCLISYEEFQELRRDIEESF